MSDPQLVDLMPIIFSYTRRQAIEDGVLFDATVDDLAEVTRQHFKIPVAMTAEVHGILERAVEHPDHGNDRRGVWHDICWMLRSYIAILLPQDRRPEVLFNVIITGAGTSDTWTLKAVMGGDDDGGPCLTIMLPYED